METEIEYKRDFETYLVGLDNCAVQSLDDILDGADKYALFATPNGRDPNIVSE